MPVLSLRLIDPTELLLEQCGGMKVLPDRWRSVVYSGNTRALGQIIFIALCLGFFARRLSDDWPALASILTELEWVRLASPFLLLIVAFFFWPVGMVVFTRGSRPGIGYLQSAQAYFGSQLTKYLPGSLWVFPSRVFLLQRSGFALSLSSAALLFEMIALAFSSCIVSISSLTIAHVPSVWNRQLTLLILVGCVVAAILFLFLPELTRRFWPTSLLMPQAMIHMNRVPILRRIGNLLLASALYAIMWLLAGVAFYLLLAATNGSLGVELVILCIGVFSFSWLAGYISVFSPGGIGVREGMIVLLLRAVVPEPYPVLVALISRTLWSIVELVFVVFVGLLARAKHVA